jgi:hypothetical protein
MFAGRRGRLAGAWIALAAWAALACGAAPAGAEDDAFIRGYAAAILQRDFDITPDAVSVLDGVVTVHANLSDVDRARLTTALGQIAGVRRVVVAPEAARPSRWSWLPRRELFRPLIADPRWPRSSAAYQYYIGANELRDVAALSLGLTFPLLSYDLGRDGAVQLGIQGAVFAIFDLDSASFDLVNADYFIALPLSYAYGDFSAMFRVFHQSSHLGDEFLIDQHPMRINLSYEAVDLLLSYDLVPPLRVYGGGGYIFDADPTDLGRGLLQAGSEYVGEPLDWWIPTRPVAALDLQFHEAGGWTPNVSPSFGLQFGSGRGEQRRLRLLFQYYNGKSPNGQFYTHHVQYVGLAAQFDY